MGCHTWCYAHIPERAKEWSDEYLESIKTEAKEMIEYLNNYSEEELLKEVKNEIANNIDWLNYYNQAKESGDVSAYLEYFGSQEKLDTYISSLHLDPNTYGPEEFKKRHIDREQKLIDRASKASNAIEFIESYDEYVDEGSLKFGLFLIHDGKMYRDTCHYRGPGFQENWIFDKQFHDIFRIHDYEAKKCYSLEETLERCKEYNIDWDATYSHGEKINELDRIKEFWETYPDGIIEFG